jgi:hypothetical protein
MGFKDTSYIGVTSVAARSIKKKAYTQIGRETKYISIYIHTYICNTDLGCVKVQYSKAPPSIGRAPHKIAEKERGKRGEKKKERKVPYSDAVIALRINYRR